MTKTATCLIVLLVMTATVCHAMDHNTVEITQESESSGLTTARDLLRRIFCCVPSRVENADGDTGGDTAHDHEAVSCQCGQWCREGCPVCCGLRGATLAKMAGICCAAELAAAGLSASFGTILLCTGKGCSGFLTFSWLFDTVLHSIGCGTLGIVSLCELCPDGDWVSCLCTPCTALRDAYKELDEEECSCNCGVTCCPDWRHCWKVS